MLLLSCTLFILNNDHIFYFKVYIFHRFKKGIWIAPPAGVRIRKYTTKRLKKKYVFSTSKSTHRLIDYSSIDPLKEELREDCLNKRFIHMFAYFFLFASFGYTLLGLVCKCLEMTKLMGKAYSGVHLLFSFIVLPLKYNS